jgi:hypothetical protein
MVAVGADVASLESQSIPEQKVAVKEHAGHSQMLIGAMKQVSFSRRAQR